VRVISVCEAIPRSVDSFTIDSGLQGAHVEFRVVLLEDEIPTSSAAGQALTALLWSLAMRTSLTPPTAAPMRAGNMEVDS
jgi:hypothetical protein